MRLNEWLDLHNISHSEMADRIGGVTAEAVRLWAAGKRMPEVKNITRIMELTDSQVGIVDLYDARLDACRKKSRT